MDGKGLFLPNAIWAGEESLVVCQSIFGIHYPG